MGYLFKDYGNDLQMSGKFHKSNNRTACKKINRYQLKLIILFLNYLVRIIPFRAHLVRIELYESGIVRHR
jgi:hypothetical protein